MEISQEEYLKRLLEAFKKYSVWRPKGADVEMLSRYVQAKKGEFDYLKIERFEVVDSNPYLKKWFSLIWRNGKGEAFGAPHEKFVRNGKRIFYNYPEKYGRTKDLEKQMEFINFGKEKGEI